MTAIIDIDERFLDDISQDLPRGTLPEHLFRDNFLPYFTQEKEMKDDSIIKTWMAIAGGPNRAVDIISPDGEVLFTIPPFYDTGLVEVHKDGVSIFTILATAQHHDKRIVGGGDRYREQALSVAEDLVPDKPSHAEVWEYIYNKYVNKEDKKEDSTETNEEEDFLDY